MNKEDCHGIDTSSQFKMFRSKISGTDEVLRTRGYQMPSP